tara:strand:+ start:2036 stop:2260 length:225 start_codon:yes stop_codon:yes gene_type:complete
MTNLNICRTEYAEYNGSPWDRGNSDAYYGRPFDPHYWPDGTYKGTMIPLSNMTPFEITAYSVGYRDCDDRKNWS